MNDEFFRQKPATAVPTGQGQEAVDANPSPESGTNVRIGAPIYEKFATNTVAIANNRAAVQAEDDQLRQAERNNRAESQEIWRGGAGKLLRQVGKRREMLDPEQFVDHPTGGAEARKSLWDREKRQAQAEHEASALILQDPAFKARKLKEEQRYELQTKGDERAREVGPDYENDPEYQGLKQQLKHDSNFDADKQALEQKAYDAKVRAFQLEQTDADTWFQNRRTAETNANRQPIVAEAQAQHAEADQAAASLAADKAALDARMRQGVKGSELPAIQAEREKHAAAEAGIVAQKQAADGNLAVVKDAAAVAKPAPEKDFFRLGDTVSGIWDAVKGLGATAPAAFYQLVEGMDRPDQYSDSAKSAFAEADAFNKEMQAKTEANQAAGTSSSVGESFREAGGSLGFSLGSMAAAIPASMAGAKVGAATGGAIGAAIGAPAAGAGAAPGAVLGASIGGTIGGVSAGMAASGTAAYRMAGASFLNEAFQNLNAESQKKSGRPMNEEEMASAYEALLPIAKNTALWEAGPEAVGNAVTMGAGKIIFGLGKPLAAKFAATIGGKTVAGAGSLVTELATETLTQVEQSADQKKAQAIAQGQDPNAIKADWTTGGVVDSFKEVAPQTLALMGLMGGAGGALKIASKATGVGATPPPATPPPAIDTTPETINTHLAAIDPEIPPATPEEIADALRIANPAKGSEGVARAVMIERELKIADETETAEYAAADEAIAQATLAGDKGALTVAEEARDRLPTKRADAARGIMKITSGTAPDDLTNDELTALGFKRGTDGKVKEQTEKELKTNGLTKTLMYAELDSGSPIITDEGLKRLAAVSPTAAKIGAMTEEQAVTAAREKFSTTTPDGAPGDPATGSTATGSTAGAAGISPAAGLSPIETKGGVETFDVPMRSGPPVRVTAATAAEAEAEAAAMFAPGENAVLPGQAVAVSPPETNEPNPQTTEPEPSPVVPLPLPEVPVGTPPPANAGVAGSDAEASAPAEAQAEAAVAPPGKKALATAKAKLAKIKKKSPKIAAALNVTNDPATLAEAKPDGSIHINPERVIAEAMRGGMDETQAADYFDRVLDEEIRHAAQYAAAEMLWKASGSKLDLATWRENHYAGIWKSDFSGKKGETARDLYTRKQAANLELWKSMSDGEKALEAIRIMSQDQVTEEAVFLWTNISDSLRTALKAALAALKQFSSPTLQQEIKNLENALRNLTESQPRAGSPKADSKKPAQGGKGAGNAPPAAQDGSGEAPNDGGTQQAPGEGTGSPLVVGARVEFTGDDGGVVTGRIAKFSKDGTKALVAVDGGGTKGLAVADVRIADTKPDTKPEQPPATPTGQQGGTMPPPVGYKLSPTDSDPMVNPFALGGEAGNAGVLPVAPPANPVMAYETPEGVAAAIRPSLPEGYGATPIISQYGNFSGKVALTHEGVSIGHVTVNYDHENKEVRIDKSEIEAKHRGKKLAKQTYIAINDALQAKGLPPLKSDNRSLTQEAIGVWKSLERQGLARERIDGVRGYEFTPTLKANNTDTTSDTNPLETPASQATAGEVSDKSEDTKATLTFPNRSAAQAFATAWGRHSTRGHDMGATEQDGTTLVTVYKVSDLNKEWIDAYVTNEPTAPTGQPEGEVAPTLDQLNDPAWHAQRVIEEIDQWVATLTNNGKRKIGDVFGPSEESRRVKMFLDRGDRIRSYATNTKASGPEASFRISINKAQTFAELRTAAEKLLSKQKVENKAEVAPVAEAKPAEESSSVEIPKGLLSDIRNIPLGSGNHAQKIATIHDSVKLALGHGFSEGEIFQAIHSAKPIDALKQLGEGKSIRAEKPTAPPVAEAKPAKAKRTIDTPARREAFRILNAQDTELTAINKILGGGGKLQSPPTGMLKIIRGLAGSRNLTEKQMAMQRRWTDYSAFQPKSAFGGTFNGKVAQELHGMLFTQYESSSSLDDWAGRLGGVNNDRAMIEVMTELLRVSRGLSKESDPRNPNRERSESEIAAETTQAATPKQNANFKESNDFDFGRNEIQVGDLSEGDTITIDGEEMTVEAVEDGGAVVLRDGTRFGRQVLESGESVYVEDESSVIEPEQLEAEIAWLVDKSEAQGYGDVDEHAAADPEGIRELASEAEALGQGNSLSGVDARREEAPSEAQGGASEVSESTADRINREAAEASARIAKLFGTSPAKPAPTSKMDIRNADSKELFADDGGFKLGQDSTVDGAKVVAARQAKEDAKVAMDAAQGDIFAQPLPSQAESPAAPADAIPTEGEALKAVEGMTDDERVAYVIAHVKKAEAEDPNIGREWDSPYGRQRIRNRVAGGGTIDISRPSYEVETIGKDEVRRYQVKSIEDDIKQDEYELTPEYAEKIQKQKDSAREAKERANEAEAERQKELDSISEFTKDMPKLYAGKVREALMKAFNFDGKAMTRKAKVEELVADGKEPRIGEEPRYKEMTRTQFNRASQREQDAHAKKLKEGGNVKVYFVGNYDMGKIGHDYAQFLIARNQAEAPAAPAKAELTLAQKVAAALAGTAPATKADKLRREADNFTKAAMKAMEGIEPGQPVLSTRDRNRRDKARELRAKASEKLNQADELDAKPASPEPATASSESALITSLDSAMAFFQRIRSGDTTAAEIQFQWKAFKAVETDITKEVMKMTMKELERFQGMRKPDNKADAVRMAMDALHGEFRPGAMFSYGGVIGNRDKMNEAKAAAQEKAVAEWTDETIQANAQERRDAKAAREKALENPETKDEWRQFVRRKGLTGLSPEEIKAFNAVRSPYDLEPKIMARGESRLTPEQLAAYDDVRGIDRKADEQARKEREATVRGVKADTDSEIVETKHTKTGADLFVVVMAERVEKDVYTSLNTAAKRLGGYYSSYRVGGAVPGFQFKDRATAEQFQAITKGETVDRSEAVQERQTERKNAAAEKLSALADRMDEAADKVIGADRKTNTAKRAREAGYAESNANSIKAMATTMRNLADAIESGEATHLDGVRTRTHVETLMNLSNRAKTDAENAENLSYSERENRKGENPTADQIAKAKYPYPFLNETAWQWLIENGNNTPGAKRLTARLEKVFSSKPSAQSNGSYITGAEMIGVIKELLGKINRQDYTRKNIEGAFENYDRVQAMGLTDLPSLRAALREFLQYRGTKAKLDPVKAMERDLVGMKLPGFFPTPQTVIEEMLDRVGDLEGKHVLEPSGGKGDIADAAKAAGADVEVIEQQSRLRDILEARGHRVIGWDFMDADPEIRGFTFGDVFQNKDNTKGIMRGQGGMGSDRVRLVREDGTEIGKYNRSELEGIERRGSNSGYDAVLMNPPFEDGQDAEHVMRAFQFLKPGGKLVAITGEGIFGRSDKKSQAFRDWLDSVGGTSEKLPEGSFKSAFRPTGVATRIVEIVKPASTLRTSPIPPAPLSDGQADFEAADSPGNVFGTTYQPIPTNELNSWQLRALRTAEKSVGRANVQIVELGIEDTAGGRSASRLQTALFSVFRKRIAFVKGIGKAFPDDGMVSTDDLNTILIDADSRQGFSYLIGHEIGHSIQHQRPDLYKKLWETLRGLASNWDDYNEILKKIPEYSEDQAVRDSEFVNDFIGSQFGEPKFWRKLYSSNRPVFRELVDFALKYLKTIGGRISEVNRDVRPYFKDIEAARKVLVQTLEAYQRGDMPNESVVKPKLAESADDELLSPKSDSSLRTSSIPAADAEYLALAKDPEKNREKLQAMVDEAAKKAGYVLKGYHGTRRKFEAFSKDLAQMTPLSARMNKPGIYFTPDISHANQFAEDVDGATDDKSRIITAYLKNAEKITRSMGYEEYRIKNPEDAKSADPVTYDESGNVIPLSQRFNPQSDSILRTSSIPPADNLESLKQRGRADFAKARPMIAEAEGTIKDFGAGSLGVDPKFANFGGSDQNVRNQVDIVRAYDMANHEVRKDRDTFARAKELLAKDPDGVYELALAGAYSEGGHLRIDDHQYLAIEMLVQRLVAQSNGDAKKLNDAQALIWANIINRKETARALRIGFDKFMTPEERANQQLSDLIFKLSPKVEKRAKTMTLKERKAFFIQAGENRVKEVDAQLHKRLGLRLEQVLRQRNDANSKATKLEKEILKLKKVLDQGVIQMIKKGATPKDVQRAYKVSPEEAAAMLQSHRDAIAARLRQMFQSGMSVEQIREAEKDSLKTSPLTPGNAMTPAEIEAEIARMMEDYKLPSKDAWLNQKALPKTPKAKTPKEEEQPHVLSTDWSKPKFYDGLNGFEFDTNDRAGIMDRVEKIRMLAGAVGSIGSLTGAKLEQAKAALAQINTILAKYGTDAEGILNADQGIESYGFDPTDMVQMAAVARTINQIDADWIDKTSEFLYANMLWGPQTALVNATAAGHAVYQMTVGRGVEMAMNHFINDPMAAQFGEVKYILRALKPGLKRAMSNFHASWLAQHPMVERDMLGSEVDWEAHAGGFRNQIKGGVIGGKFGDMHRTPLRILSATDDFNKTLFGMAEAAAFAYRLGVKKSKTQGDAMFGKGPGTPEFEKFMRVEMNTPGSFSMKMGVDKASKMIFAQALPGQKNHYTGETERADDIGGVIGLGAAKLNEFVSSGDHDSIAAKAMLAMLRISFFPFQRTPFNIVRTGMRYAPNPISMTDILWGGISNSRQMNAKTGKMEFKWNAQGRNPELIERMGQQLQGAVVMATLMALAAGEGDDDDQDKWLVMTGTAPWSPAKRAEKDARDRSGVGSYRISFLRKDGSERFGFSYARIEPLATALSTTIDTLRTIKRISKNGGDASDIAANTLGGLVAQTKEKTFMRGFSDMTDLITNAVAADDVKEPNQRKMNQFLVGRIAMAVPNFIKQPLRETDRSFRERSDSFGEELMYQVFPHGQKAAKVDPYGEKMEKQELTGIGAVDSAVRILDVGDSGTDKVNPIDRMLLRWRDGGKWKQAADESGRKPWFPSPILSAEFKHAKTGQNVKMNGEQLQEFREKAGQRAMVLLKSKNLNTQNPTARDVETVKDAISQARSELKKMLGFKFSKS